MKKVILALLLVFGAIQLTQAQKIDFGIKAGINYNYDSFNKDALEEIYDDASSKAESKTGFHAGIWTRFKLPIVGLYIRPELVYTALKSEITASGETLADYDFQKIDVPVLLGKNFLKIAHIYAGPSFQYLIDGDFDDYETEVDGITVGMQLGAGIELGSLGLDVRWERGFSDVESSLIDNQSEFDDFEFDTRVNQIIVSLSLKF